MGALKRDRLDRQPSDNALGKHADVQVSRDTVGAWLRGERFPQQVDPLLAVLAQIRAEADCRGLLGTPVDSVAGDTVSELLDLGRWRRAWEDEQQGRVQANKDAAYRQRAQAALEDNERRARQAALADRPRPLRYWSAQRLGVHPAIAGCTTGSGGEGFVLPRYVPRLHDAELRQRLSAATVEKARPLLVVVCGESCTGKTRTAFEALHAAVPDDFNLLFPADADGLLEVLAADAVAPRTVVWLNEAQDYLDGPKSEAVSAGLLRCLDTDGPLLMIATLWPDHDQRLTKRSAPGTEDRHRSTRALLAQAHYTRVPDSFSNVLDAVRKAARGDRSLAAAVQTGGADLTQTLAAGPDLVAHYEYPAGEYGVYGRALISAAMDAYRLGATGPLPLGFLEAAATGYLTGAERAVANPDLWFAGAFAHARTLIKQTVRPLQDVPRPSGIGALPDVARLADYLQQHGRRTRRTQCPPASFWDAAVVHLIDPTDLTNLADAAKQRLRYRHAAKLHCAAANAGNTHSLWMLARMREEAGDQQEAERLYLAAANAAHPETLMFLAEIHSEAGRNEEAERLLRQAVDAGHNSALPMLAAIREQAGDKREAERLAQQAAHSGDTIGLTLLAEMRKNAGDKREAERLAQMAVDAGDSYALTTMAVWSAEAGDQQEAERLYLAAANAGNSIGVYFLAKIWEEAGDQQRAEQLYRSAVDAGHTHLLMDLAQTRRNAGNLVEAERLAQQAADTGDGNALITLAGWCEETGDYRKAEHLYLAAANAGFGHILEKLASLRQDSPEMYKRYGLDAGGALSGPWEWPEPRSAFELGSSNSS
ncbi:hypothetical protein AB0P34_15645 [Nocardiopsis alba]|uniref:tetratricopeptide repeat protein n=1 Tax=Nocardiopsis alba TaxID=53437 RepID=UPI003435C4E3